MPCCSPHMLPASMGATPPYSCLLSPSLQLVGGPVHADGRAHVHHQPRLCVRSPDLLFAALPTRARDHQARSGARDADGGAAGRSAAAVDVQQQQYRSGQRRGPARNVRRARDARLHARPHGPAGGHQGARPIHEDHQSAELCGAATGENCGPRSIPDGPYQCRVHALLPMPLRTILC